MNRLQKALRTKYRKQALVISVIIHVMGIGLTFYFVKPPPEQIVDTVRLEFLTPTQRQMTRKKRMEKIIKTTKPVISAPAMSVKKIPATHGTLPIATNTPRLELPPVSTVTRLAPSPRSLLADSKLKTPEVGLGSGTVSEGVGLSKRGTGRGVAPSGRDKGRGTLGTGVGLGNSVQDGIPLTEDSLISSIKDEIGDKLDSIIDESDGVVRGHIRLIRLKHNLSDWWQDPTAIPSLIKWLLANQPNISADMDYMGGALKLTDKSIMDAPLLIMTGHDQAMGASYAQLKNQNSQAKQFTATERAALREYILEHKGMLFFDYCGDGGHEKSFASLVENELREIFPEHPLTTLDNIQHDIFQCYFKLKKTPVGGSFFWGTGYKGGNLKWRYLKGISVPGKHGKPRLAVIFCPLDYLCSMETAEVDSRAPLASRRSSDVYRFMTNMFIYQMRQRTEAQK